MTKLGDAMAARLTIRLRFAIILIWIASALSAFSQTRHIVLLYDERIDLPGLASLNAGLTRALISGSPDHIEIYREEMDLSRFDSEGYRDLLRDEFRARYAAKKIDVVVAVMAPAVDFLLSHRDEIFPGTPMVFCGLDRKQLGDRSLPADVTGVLVTREFSPTLNLVARLHPDTERIVVVAGTSEFDARLLAQAREEFKPFEKRFAFTYLTNFPLPELLLRLSQLPPKTVVLYTTMFRDGAGQPYVPHDAAERISAAANAPVYGFLDQYVGHGIVGGRVYGLGLHGEEAAGLVLKILSGRKPQQLSPIEPADTVTMFDARQLQRWKINEHRLPAGSTVLFREPTVWDRYRIWIIGGVSICILQALLITGLLLNLFRRRRAEFSLTESERRFETMADAAPIMIWMTGEDKLCTFVNKAWLAFTGRRMEQELGNGWSEGVHRDDFENAIKTYVAAFDARRPFTMRYRIRRHDGEYRFITDSGGPRFGPHGRFRGYVGACVDVTDLLEKQKALSEFEERVALATEAAHLGVWERDLANNNFWISDKARELFQFDPSEPVTYTQFRERTHPEDLISSDLARNRAIETKSGYELEYRVLLPGGTVRWIAGRARCILDENGNVARLLGVLMDVTERKQAQDLFQLATEASTSGTLLVDGQGHILLVNAQTEKLFNYWRDELIGKPVEMLVPKGFAEYLAHREKFVAAPEPQMMGAEKQLFGRRKDGSEFPVEIGLNSIKTPRGILILASVIDITARQLAEEQERMTREEINRLSRISLLGEMTASIAHELNQPLSGITSNANAGQRFIDRGDADIGMLREILVDIAADGRRASDVINNIRNTIKKGAAVRKWVKINDIVMDVAHMMRPDTTACSCHVQLSLAKGLPVVEGDPVQLHQVLINLVTNAFEAMRHTPPSRRTLEIATERNGSSSIHVSVRDHGMGISDEVHEHLFDQFFTTKEDGLGMGLAIVHSIIEAHGGRIEAENVNGGGACFHFTLPVTKKISK